MNTETIMNTIKQARGLQTASGISPAVKMIVKKLADALEENVGNVAPTGTPPITDIESSTEIDIIVTAYELLKIIPKDHPTYATTKNIADLAQASLKRAINAEQKETERAKSLDLLRENFEDASKEEVLEHVNKIIESTSGIVKAAIKYETARDRYQKANDGDGDVDELDALIDEEFTAGAKLIECVKEFHNGAPEQPQTTTQEETQ